MISSSHNDVCYNCAGFRVFNQGNLMYDMRAEQRGCDGSSKGIYNKPKPLGLDV